MTTIEVDHAASPKVSAGLLRREKIQKMKMDHSATSIQATWRGKAFRKDLNKIIPEGTLDASSEPKYGFQHTELDSRNRCNNKEDDDDGYIEAKEDIDDEENAAVAAAEHFEQRQLQEAKSYTKLPTWPDSLTDNFDDPDWPDLSNNGGDGSQEQPTGDWNIRIRTITWNLCAKKPPSAEMARVKLFPRNKFHLVVIGSEECERSIAQSAVNTSKKMWEAYLTEVLGGMYVPLRSHTLQAIHIMAFAHISIANLCSEIGSAAVATGMGNTLGNKGGVAISMKIGRTKFVFANAHLAAHQNAVKQRNNDYQKISQGLPILLQKNEMKMRARLLAKKQNGIVSTKIKNSTKNSANNNSSIALSPRASSSIVMNNDLPDSHIEPDNNSYNNSGNKSPNNSQMGTGINIGINSALDLGSRINSGLGPGSGIQGPGSEIGSGSLEFSECGDRVVFMGDLNYRVRGNRSVVSKLLDMGMHEVMLNNDQLITSMEKGAVLVNFTEPPLNFRPTYKLDIDSDLYDTGSKRRIPAWTDRVLYVKKMGFFCTAYDSDKTLRTSDHRPVFASFIASINVEDSDSGYNGYNGSRIDENGEKGENGDSEGGNSPRNGNSSGKERSLPEFSSESQVCTLM